MKKALIIANLFHASPRIPGISLHLPEFGWEPTIITPPLKDDFKKMLAFPAGFKNKIRIIETDSYSDMFSFWRKILVAFGFKKEKSILGQVKKLAGAKKQVSFIDRIFLLYAVFFAYPDEEKKWEKKALKTAEKILSQEKFDFVISSSSPVTSHIIAKAIKEKYKIPWVADLRDLWTENNNYPYPFFRKVVEAQLERKTLSSADSLITVSGPLADKLKAFYKKKKVYVITNGYFLEELNFAFKPLKNKFSITYAGNIYSGKQDPENLFIALTELISKNTIKLEDLEINFYCGALPWLENEIKKYGLKSNTHIYEKISRKEINEKQQESQILLLIYFGNKEEKGWQSLKIFGYLASQRPILAINGLGDDVVKEMLEKTKGGAYCTNIEEIKNALKIFYFDYKKNGKVAYGGDLQAIKKYSYQEKARELASVLNNF